ncbi:serine hydrolase domain-containing protein [Deinococcus roseus]|uniref:D-Ala-D-Ala carboxypeptidase n=1 Tax=Deinococcus roseus TaxID=392414 RepID=A0ABQ2CY39_9DEIO|nr:serine hydrolase domain-containing protein [Deinococcus roseus]GGJ28070.1 D-Ala-D-Ala carboxypeptidase [Deinococcus roseus]
MKKILLLVLPLAVGSALAAPDYAAVLDAHHNARFFMGNVVILKDGQPLFEKAVGQASVEFGIPANSQTVYEIGSITKSFTAVAILKLQEQGKLKVTDALSKYLPDFPNGDRITLHHLLTHTSGVTNFTAFPGFLEVQKQNFSQSQIVDLFKDKPLDFEPGDHFSYSNSGFTLLGQVIEKASGMPYQEYIRQNVLQPLKFKDLDFHSRLDLVPNRASGYVLNGASYQVPELHNVEIAGPAGGLYATASELARWLPDLFAGKILNAESIKAFSSPQVNTGAPLPGFEAYGYGVGMGKLFGHPVVSHGGNINGFNAMMAYFPEEKLSIAVLSNLDGISSQDVMVDLARAYFEVPYTLPQNRTFISVPENVLSTYTGTYRTDLPALQLKFRVVKGQLQLEIPEQGIFTLLPETENRFYLSALDVTLTFQKNGDALDVQIQTGGQTLTGKRQSP